MEDYNIKYTMHNNDNSYPVMQPPAGHNGWMGGEVTVLQTADVAAIIQTAVDGGAPEHIAVAGGGGGETAAKTWADMVKKSGNCSSGETRFCAGPTVDHHINSNGVKTIGGEKRRSAANGRYNTDRPPRGGPKNNNYGGHSSNFSSNNYQNNSNGGGGPRMNHNNNGNGNNFYDRYHGRGGPNFKSAHNEPLVGGNGNGGQIDAIDQANDNVSNNGVEPRSVNTTIVPMVSLQQQFYGMNLGTSVAMPPPGIFQAATFNGGAGGPRMMQAGGGGSAYIPLEANEFQAPYMTFAAHTTSSALFVPPLSHGGVQVSTGSGGVHGPIPLEAQHHSPQPHHAPQSHHHQMTTTQQLHLWQQQQAALLQQQQHQAQATRPHAPVPQPQPPSGQQPQQQSGQLSSQHNQLPQQQQHGQQQLLPQVHMQQQHPSQQQQMQPIQVQQNMPGQAPAAGPPQGGPLPQGSLPPPQGGPLQALPQFFIPAAFSANSPNGAALMFPQPIMPIPALGHHMGAPPSLICTPPGAAAPNNGGAGGPQTGVDTVAAAGGPIFVHPNFQDDKFRNTWLQQDHLPSVQWLNERCLQHYVLSHNNNMINAKERSIANTENGSKESVVQPNLLLASCIQYNGGGGAMSAKSFHLKA